jgi:hypothetical protein
MELNNRSARKPHAAVRKKTDGCKPVHRRPATDPATEKGGEPMMDLMERTIAILKKASDFAAAAYDNDLVEVEIDGAKVSTISLELQLRTLASKLERKSRTSRMQNLADA